MKQIFRILGIDPGLRYTGWGLIEKSGNRLSFINAGHIATNSQENIGQRLKMIYEGMNDILETYQPDHVAIEQVFVNKNSLSSLKLGQARGVSLVAAALKDFIITEYAPNLVKKAIVGNGHATKEQIYKMVKVLLPKAGMQTNDEADALAIAICHAHHL